jgi:hypothetical protein
MVLYYWQCAVEFHQNWSDREDAHNCHKNSWLALVTAPGYRQGTELQNLSKVNFCLSCLSLVGGAIFMAENVQFSRNN